MVVPTGSDDTRRLPLPLAQLCRCTRNAKTALEQHLTAVHLWEAAFKLLASAAVVRYLCLSPSEPAVTDQLKGLARASLGTWWRFSQLLLPRLEPVIDLS